MDCSIPRVNFNAVLETVAERVPRGFDANTIPEKVLKMFRQVLARPGSMKFQKGSGAFFSEVPGNFGQKKLLQYHMLLFGIRVPTEA